MSALPINSENAEYQIIEALKNNHAKRHKLNELFIEGTECIKQALDAGMEITRLIYADKSNLSDWAKSLLAAQKSAGIISMEKKLFAALCDKTNPGELLVTAVIQKHTLEEINAEHPFIVLFDRPGDMGNLGSAIRSANAFGADAVFILGHGVDVYDPKVIRSSLGSVFHTKIIRMDSLDMLENYIKNRKTKMIVIGTDSNGTESLAGYFPVQPFAALLIMGNEAKGMSVKLKSLCDTIIKIPVIGKVNSLNMACAASIFMWEVFKVRKATF